MREVNNLEDAAEVRERYTINDNYILRYNEKYVSATAGAHVRGLDRALTEAQYFASEGDWRDFWIVRQQALKHARSLR